MKVFGFLNNELAPAPAPAPDDVTVTTTTLSDGHCQTELHGDVQHIYTTKQDRSDDAH
ncbi:hypothetical protein ACWEPZ_06485 [Streptomyces sp. NPDC004288]